MQFYTFWYDASCTYGYISEMMTSTTSLKRENVQSSRWVNKWQLWDHELVSTNEGRMAFNFLLGVQLSHDHACKKHFSWNWNKNSYRWRSEHGYNESRHRHCVSQWVHILIDRSSKKYVTSLSCPASVRLSLISYHIHLSTKFDYPQMYSRDGWNFIETNRISQFHTFTCSTCRCL